VTNIRRLCVRFRAIKNYGVVHICIFINFIQLFTQL